MGNTTVFSSQVTFAFTGGGSGGHVTPNLALIESLKKAGFRCIYFGTETGIEAKLVRKEKITFYPIRSGKLRRYFSWQTFFEPFKVILGFFTALKILKKEKPTCLFSKGGFVAVPVVYAAKCLKIPVIIHESDVTPGLANRLCFPFADKVCITFSASQKIIKQSEKIIETGTPIRAFLFHGNKERGKQYCHFSDDKPVLLVIGGGLGSQFINETIRKYLDKLLLTYNVIHLCGQGKIDEKFNNTPGYCQIDFAEEQMADFYACADLAISRAGANSIYELLALKIPHILVPLPLSASRGEQIANAQFVASQNLSYIMPQEILAEHFLEGLKNVEMLQSMYRSRLEKANFRDGKRQICELMQSYIRKDNASAKTAA